LKSSHSPTSPPIEQQLCDSDFKLLTKYLWDNLKVWGSNQIIRGGIFVNNLMVPVLVNKKHQNMDVCKHKS
jgi:hypothetical protein